MNFFPASKVSCVVDLLCASARSTTSSLIVCGSFVKLSVGESVSIISRYLVSVIVP